MKVNYYKVTNGDISEIHQEIKLGDWGKNLSWIEIQEDNRKEVADYLDKAGEYKDAHGCIEHPENNPFSNIFEKIIILNIPVSNIEKIYKTDYISVILYNKLIITIMPWETNLFTQKVLTSYSEKEFSSFLIFLAYIAMRYILTQNSANLRIANFRIAQLEQLLTNSSDKFSSKELMSCERDISQLSDIMEDQYVGFGILASINSGKLDEEGAEHTNTIIEGFVPLNNAMQRLEKKADSLRLHYMLIQQEKSTRKINVLTIVQAVFVPLTFIAGIYGMNFVDIPELNFEYGYLYVWILFIGLASALLAYFYKNHWFD